MNGASTAKFQFDQSFEVLAQARRADGGMDIYTAEDLARARAEGRAKGHAEGRAELQRETEALAAKALHAIAAQVSTLAATQKTVLTAVNRDSTELAVAMARKLALSLTQRYPLDEIETLIRECLEEIALEPRVVIRVSSDLVASLEGKLADIAHRASFEGKLVLLGEPAMTPGNCQIDWADGGMERDGASVARHIDEGIERLLAAGLVPDFDAAAGTPPAADPNAQDPSGDRHGRQ